ncbi:MAG: nucleoside 2-deoxyribosyltransferase [Acidobacteria bacterium]|jgi:nucleoside 2-deoxyribosyltransferase|nr:nucleoside 2-deoxyribosyltransferase [Acidobacteriota bacterium]
MESFKLFPQPDDEICTPFIYQKDDGIYTRLMEEKSDTQWISIAKNGKNFLVSGVEKEKLIGQRSISRERILDFISLNPSTNGNFLNYVRENTVIPTFTLSLHEALIKVLIKQLIGAKQAKKIFSAFIKNFGYNSNKGYAFPSIKVLKGLSLEDLKSMKLGYKAPRILEIIRQISQDDILKPQDFLSKKIKGLGPWSQDILRMEFAKDYAFYPFYDLSGEKIFDECGVDLNHISKYDRGFAGDIYVYAASFLENKPLVHKRKFKKVPNVYLAYSVTNKEGESNLTQMKRLREWLVSKNYNVFNPTPKLFQEKIANDALERLDEADIIVADLSRYSHGVGFEVGYAFAKEKKIVLIAEENSRKKVSKFLKGVFESIIFYGNTEQLIYGVEKMLESRNMG